MKCAVCGSENIVSKNYLSRDNFEIELFQCPNCEHLSQNTETFVDIYTSGEFSKIARDDSYLPDKKKINELDKKAFERFEFYNNFINQNNNFLEIGSSIGSFVHLLKLAGKQAQGLEPDPNYAKFAKKQYGFSQFPVLLENFTTEKKFDAAYSFHVIEHIEKPQLFVEKLSNLLTLGAEILFECPSFEIHNFGNMKTTVWKPHIHYFSAPSLYFLFSQYFKVKSITYNGASIYIKAENYGQSTFHETVLDNYKKRAKRIFLANSKIPSVTNKFPAKQLAIQSVIQKEKMNFLFNKGVRYSAYKIDELKFLRKERGNKGEASFHVTNFKGWGNNAGDIVLSKCVRDVLRQKKELKFNIKAISEGANEKTVQEINKSKFFVIGGGGLLLPDTNENSVSGWQWAISPDNLQKINIPFIVYAIGYNYFRGQKTDNFFLENLNLLIEKSDFFSLRNWGSINKVNELTQNKFKEKIIYQPCPTTVIRKFDKTIPLKKKTKNIAVNVAFDRPLLRFGQDYEQILTGIAKAVKSLELKGYKIFNFTHITADRKFEILLDRYNINYKTVELQYMLPNEMYRLYNSMELVLGMRGHAQMIPFGLNTKIITLGTHDKMRWFLEDIDASDWYIELNNQSKNIEELILDKAEDILEKNASFVEQKLIEKQNMLFEITQTNLAKIYKIIK